MSRTARHVSPCRSAPTTSAKKRPSTSLARGAAQQRIKKVRVAKRALINAPPCGHLAHFTRPCALQTRPHARPGPARISRSFSGRLGSTKSSFSPRVKAVQLTGWSSDHRPDQYYARICWPLHAQWTCTDRNRDDDVFSGQCLLAIARHMT